MDRSPRLALFTDTLDETNGVAHTYRMLADHAERTGLSVDFYAPGPEGNSRESRGSVNIFRFARRMSVEYYDDLHFSLAPNRLVPKVFREQPEYDLIHVAAPGNLGSWGRKLATRLGKPLVGVHHTQLQDYAALRSPKILASLVRSGSLELLRRFYRPCSLVLTPTPKIGEIIRSLGLAKRTDVFSRGVDAHRFSPARRTRSREEACRLLFVGRLAVEKNLDALARILSRLKERSSFEMHFVGDGPLRDSLQARLPWAKFQGVLKGGDLAEAYANADLFVFPSLTDTFGNVVNEAQASGVPCLVMDPHGPGEVIEPGRTGLVAPSEEAFLQEAEALLHAKDRRRKMGEEARALAASRDWDQVFSRLWGIYRLAAEGRLSTPEGP